MRDAQLDDARALAHLHVRSWRAAYRGVVPDAILDGLDVDRRAAEWIVRLAGRDGATLVVEGDAGTMAAFARFGANRGEEAVAELYAFYLAPECWGTGLASALMDVTLAALPAWGDEAVLWVFEHNPRARRFYENAGWRADGGRQFLDFDGVPVPEVRYRRSL